MTRTTNKPNRTEASIDAPFKAEGERMREEVDRMGGVTKLGAELKVTWKLPRLINKVLTGTFCGV